MSADVVLAGTSTVALGPADLTLAEGTTNVVYAWGSSTAGYQLAVQTISGGHSAPSGVPGGTGGLLDDGSLPMPVAALSVIGLVAAGVGALRLTRSPRLIRRRNRRASRRRPHRPGPRSRRRRADDLGADPAGGDGGRTGGACPRQPAGAVLRGRASAPPAVR